MRASGESEVGLIIAAWCGFEIDSSEGYYVFDQEMEHVDDGSGFLTRLLSSSLVWKTVAFSFRPRRGRPGAIDGVLAGWRKSRRIRVEQRDGLGGETEVIAASDFLELFQEVRADLEAASVYFAVVPPKLLAESLRRKLRTWFFRQFSEDETARRRWADYLRLGEKDIKLAGHTEWTDSWSDDQSLEATFEIRLEKPFAFRVFIPAGDPTLMVYLLWQIAGQFRLTYEGDHGISINRTPDQLPIAKLMSEEDTG